MGGCRKGIKVSRAIGGGVVGTVVGRRGLGMDGAVVGIGVGSKGCRGAVVGRTVGVPRRGAGVLTGLGARVGVGWREGGREGSMVGVGVPATGATGRAPP